MDNEQGIKTMKLYHQVERVFNELRALGIGPDDPIDPEVLSQFDQYHYLGTDAVDEAVKRLGITSDMRVLEIGGGIGGPSRHLARVTGCHMTALELQPDLNEVAKELTERCGLSDRVTHVQGDILKWEGTGEPFDAIVSWLTFLHIPERVELYKKCAELLKTGGGLYVEDYFAKGKLTNEERQMLASQVFCRRVPTMNEIREELLLANFSDIELIDISEPWVEFVVKRRRDFLLARDRNLALHGSEIVCGLENFYKVIVKLFNGERLGGVNIVSYNNL